MSKTNIKLIMIKGSQPFQGGTWFLGTPINKKLISDVNGEATITVDQLLVERVMGYVAYDAGNASSLSLDIDATTDESFTWDGNQFTKTTYAADDVPHAKSVKNALIDERTQELIAQGFTHNAKTLSLSKDAQTNWIGAEVAKVNLTFPLKISTKDDDEYIVNDIVEYGNLYVTGVGTKQAHLDSGRALKLQVDACTTVAEVDAIVDNR